MEENTGNNNDYNNKINNNNFLGDFEHINNKNAGQNNNFEQNNNNIFNYDNSKLYNTGDVFEDKKGSIKNDNNIIYNNNANEGNNEIFNNDINNINNENFSKKEYLNNDNKNNIGKNKDYFNIEKKNDIEPKDKNINNDINNDINQILNNLYDEYNNNNSLENNNNGIFTNNEIVIPPEPDKPIIKLGFMTRARGLANVGATCYMNATLQCFYHVKKLSENLINDNKITPSMEITYCYKNLIEELAGCKNRNKFFINAQNYTSDDKLKDYFEPYAFKDLISAKNPLFKGIQANDSKDLIIFLLENMDNELTQRNNRNLPKQVFDGRNVEQTNEQNFKKVHNSIFSEIFYGFQKSIMKCLSCQHADETYNVFNFLIFPLEKVYNDLLNKKRNNNMNNNMMYNNMFNNMMPYNMMPNNMMYNNMMYNNMPNMYNNIYSYNNNMNIFGNNMFNNNMNMFRNMYMYNNNHNNMNINYSNNYNNFSAQKEDLKKFNFPTTISNSGLHLNDNNETPKLNLYDCFKENENEEILSGSNQIFCNNCRRTSNALTKNEMYKVPNVLILILNRGRGNVFKCDVDFPHQLDLSQFVKNPSSPNNFQLIGVISHLGESSMDGHFIAFCKHFDDNWYLFNDGMVTQVSPYDIKRGTPYILFYQNINFN